LKKQSAEPSTQVDSSQLVEPAEKALHSAIENIELACTKLFDQGDYAKGLEKLASLRSPVDEFFEHVMVLSDDVAQQKNRLAILKRMQNLFLRVADIALLQT